MYKVSATSALVLLWTDQSIYDSPSAQKFFGKISLDAGEPLRKELEMKDLHFYEEVTNRKYGVKKLCANFLTKNSHGQVIFLGSGLDPKSIDIAENFPDSHVFDVDTDNMDVKESITKQIGGPKNITFCKANIGQIEEMQMILKKQKWNKDKTTLIVAEGISYYVSKSIFKKSIESLKTSNGGMVLEYSIPHEDGSKSGHILFFDKLQQLLGSAEPLCLYNVQEVNVLAQDLGGRLVVTMDQTMLEKERTKKNIFYNTYSGFIRVSFIQF